MELKITCVECYWLVTDNKDLYHKNGVVAEGSYEGVLAGRCVAWGSSTVSTRYALLQIMQLIAFVPKVALNLSGSN